MANIGTLSNNASSFILFVETKNINLFQMPKCPDLCALFDAAPSSYQDFIHPARTRYPTYNFIVDVAFYCACELLCAVA